MKERSLFTTFNGMKSKAKRRPVNGQWGLRFLNPPNGNHGGRVRAFVSLSTFKNNSEIRNC
jgi:hypothetical protein